jgi:hypothetical protein
MLDFLKQPYPCNNDIRFQLKLAFYISFFVTLFLILFKPFGLSNYPGADLNLLILGYGITCFLVLISVFLILRKFKKKSEETWTTGKEILETLIYIFFVAIGNLLYTHFVFGSELTFASLIQFQVITLLVGVFPVTALVVANQFRLLKKNARQAEQMNADLTVTHASSVSKDILLIADNEKDSVKTDDDSLLFIEASDNYSTVYFVLNGQLKSHLLRSSLKRLESQINNPNVIRCHRTYIVNLLKVESVTGNAQGYRLRFRHFDQSIPVSRNLNDAIKNKIHRLTR